MRKVRSPKSRVPSLLGLCLGLCLAAPAWAGSTTEALVQQPSPFAGVLKELRCRAAAANDSDESWTLTVRLNGTSTPLTCTISTSGRTCTDLGSTVPVVVGDLLDIFVDNTAGASPS